MKELIAKIRDYYKDSDITLSGIQKCFSLEYNTAYSLFVEILKQDIEDYIKKCDYTWTFEEIKTEYSEKYKSGWYVSHTCKDVINKFENRLKRVF